MDRTTKLSIDRVMAGRRAGDPAMLVADSSRLREMVDWTPRFEDLDTIIKYALARERKLADIRRTAPNR